ncbi:MAG TPA: cell division protein [Bdellovibrionales bacterium]|nr:cell division protein [Pseudobdellovibrionaceae bacterium]HAG90516.1 cell division protein [Bdellovibrionales bacterium]|tara:strand:- start:14357 stop:16315 length:1959 start_codon:yes stop_codon:yes gene_type:complete
MKLRILILFSLLLAVWGFLVLRAAQIQIFPDHRLAKLKERQFETSLAIRSRRGTIYDRYGKELAVSVPSYSLFVDPKMIKDPKKTAKEIGILLRQSRKNLYRKFTKKHNRFIWVARQLDEEKVQKIRAMKNPGLGFVEEPKRIYPNGSLLGQVLGFVGRDGRGLEGLEKSFDKSLAGEMRKIMVARDARGRPLLPSASVFNEIPDGADIELTVDSDLQFEMEKQLSESVAEFDAESALGVILDVETSDILAIGMTPKVDLNHPFRSSSKDRRNRIISDAFEPGSTMKTFVIASALKAGVAQPNTKFFCENGRFQIGRRVITEADSHHNFQWLTVTEILAHSSNIGTSKIAFKLGAEKLRESLLEFGFGHDTGVNFPGESQGIVQKLPWNKHLLANISFGHGIAVTPLQMATAYAAIANGGVLRKPRLVRRVKSYKENDPQDMSVDEGRRIFDEELAAHLRMMLTVATGGQGTGSNARIPGFLVGGKTGTAQMVDFKNGGYKSGSYIASFAGFAPAHNPKYVIYVAVKDPKKAYYGSEVAAPIFAKLAQYGLRKLSIPPVILSQKNVMEPEVVEEKTWSKEQEQAIAKALKEVDKSEFPDLKGLALREALRRMGPTKNQVRIKGSGVVSRTSPSAGEKWEKDKSITIYLDEVQ